MSGHVILSIQTPANVVKPVIFEGGSRGRKWIFLVNPARLFVFPLSRLNQTSCRIVNKPNHIFRLLEWGFSFVWFE